MVTIFLAGLSLLGLSSHINHDPEKLDAPRSISKLAERLAPLAAAHKGRVSIAVRHFASGEEYFLKADEIMPTASLIKMAIMVEAFHQRQEKRVDFEKDIVVTKEDMVPGAGVITRFFNPGVPVKLKNAIGMMIAFSDNTATNLVLDQIGIPSTNKRMAEFGFPETRINAKVFKGSTTSIDKDRTEKYGLGSTRSRDMVNLLTMIYQDKIISKEVCKELRTVLFDCEDFESIPRFLPPGTRVAYKTGAVSESKTAAGIIYPKKGGPFAICIMTADNEVKGYQNDNPGKVLVATVAKATYDYFQEFNK